MVSSISSPFNGIAGSFEEDPIDIPELECASIVHVQQIAAERRRTNILAFERFQALVQKNATLKAENDTLKVKIAMLEARQTEWNAELAQTTQVVADLKRNGFGIDFKAIAIICVFAFSYWTLSDLLK